MTFRVVGELLVEYLKLAVYLGLISIEVQRSILMSPYTQLYQQFWWTFWIFVGNVALPLLFIRYVSKESFADHGLGWGDTSAHKWGMWHWCW